MSPTRAVTFVLLAALLGAASPASAGQNDRLRQGAKSDKRDNSDGGSSSSSSDDGCASACNLVSAILDFATCCGNATTSSRTTVVVQPGASNLDSGGSSSSGGPYAVPDGPGEPFHFVAVGGIARTATTTLIVTPRLQLAFDIPLDRHQAFRIGFDHESFFEWVEAKARAEVEIPAHWDQLPLSTIRGGWVWREASWELALVGGLRLMDIGDGDGFAAGVDLGAQFGLERDGWFFEAGLLGLAFERLVGVEPWVRGGLSYGPLRLGLGWRHLNFFDVDVIQYTGPEVTLGIRL